MCALYIDLEHVDSSMFDFVSYQELEIHIGNHQMLPIEDELAPERYLVEKCQTHKTHTLDEICKDCRTQFCKRCDTKIKCPFLSTDCHQAAGFVDQGKLLNSISKPVVGIL